MASRLAAATAGLMATTAMQAADPNSFRPPTVGIVLKFEQKPSSRYLKQLQATVEEMFRPSGLDLRWEVAEPGSQPGQHDRVVVVDMKGRCTDWPQDWADNAGPGRVELGYTLLHDGEVIPFSGINCEDLGRTARGAHRHLVQRPYLPATYWRLMGRVFTHELLHALLRNPDHQETDCGRSPLRPLDVGLKVQLKTSEIAALREVGRTPVDAAVARTGGAQDVAERTAGQQ